MTTENKSGTRWRRLALSIELLRPNFKFIEGESQELVVRTVSRVQAPGERDQEMPKVKLSKGQ